MAQSPAPQEDARPHIARAQDLLRACDREGARREAETALRLPAADLVARNALGSVFYELGLFAPARELFQGVLAENPRYGDALNNLGNILAREGKPRAALEFYGRALASVPDHPDYLANLGGAHQALGDVAGALRSFERALMIDPAHADARWNRGIARLLMGDLGGGFADYEVRWTLPEFAARSIPAARWTGGDLAGRSILIHSEQGYGDTIQMVRFARRLKSMGARVVLETHAPLVRLMQTADGIDEVMARGELLPPFDLHLPVMSLPGACGVASLADIPADVPYLRAPEGPDIDLGAHADGAVRVGLVWAGRPTHRNDRNRSLPSAAFEPLARIAGVRLYSLQAGAPAHDASFAIDLAPRLTDFAATARAISALDLVISVDTAVAHLAGALGKECWVLLPFAPDWRWLLDRADSPWYPTLRLFRQARLDDWEGVVARVADALGARTSR